MAILNESTVSVKRSFNAPAKAVFEAISKGVLFRTCGAKPDSIQIDFREGGNWQVDFDCHLCGGKFVSVVPHSRIAFTWDGESVVTISLTEAKGITHMHLLHEGIKLDGRVKDIDWGWRDGVNDFTHQITRSLKVQREIDAPLEKVYELCAGPQFFLRVGAIKGEGSADFRVGGRYFFHVTGCHKGDEGGDFVEGEFTNIQPNYQVVFTWSTMTQFGPTGETLVSMKFEKQGDEKTLVTLIHSGFPSEDIKKDHEQGWTQIFEEFRQEHK